MYAIRFKGTDKWIGKQNITYAVSDDNYYKHQDPTGQGLYSGYICSPKWHEDAYGKRPQYRKVWETTDALRRSFRGYTGATIVHNCGGGIGMLGPQKGNIGTFSHYEVVNLITGSIHSLESVFKKVI